MDAVAITIGISWTLVGLISIALSVPLIRGHIRPNAFYGVRFPQSFESDEAWFAINRFGGMRLAVWSTPLVVVGLVSFFLPLRSNTALALVLGFAPLVFILIPVFESWRFARRYRPRG
ncbi:SdpI family protein [Humisphaera borealis]|uniref:SdpI family protein n=1 Tax=Humisphaera borealis TaxID=2807512 RepID=A0A7M2WQB7_9BACT|nr:SdpI family protein [Humisphaera borealis]QOV87444.1 SdpI family protein [Humisphaera borealis]